MAPQPERRADTVAISRKAYTLGSGVATVVLAALAVGVFRFALDYGALIEVVEANEQFRLQGGRFTARRGQELEDRVKALEVSHWEHERKAAHDLAEYRIRDVQERCKKIEELVDRCKENWNLRNQGPR